MTTNMSTTLKPGTISHGTLRAEDLIPRFLAALSEVDPERAAEINADKPSDDDEEWMEFWINNTLWDALNDCCPGGYYFGAHPGDGADFGVWPIDTSED